MRSLKMFFVLVLLAAGLVRAAGPGGNARVVKMLKPSSSSRTIPALAGAGPVWRNAAPLKGGILTEGMLRKSGSAEGGV
ncbi:hypothetical protein JW777_06350, partial [bacterium]|nr:hypothetical protein [bacterium]